MVDDYSPVFIESIESHLFDPLNDLFQESPFVRTDTEEKKRDLGYKFEDFCRDKIRGYVNSQKTATGYTVEFAQKMKPVQLGGKYFKTLGKNRAGFFRGDGSEIAEIDCLMEYYNGSFNPCVTPIVVESTLCVGKHDGVSWEKKTRLIEEVYGSKPMYLEIRPASGDKEPGIQKIDDQRRKIFVRQVFSE